MSLPNWTPERVALLERLWTDGLSASEIAGQLSGVTRNAVLGKLHRLGRLGRGRPTAPARQRKPRPVRAPALRRPKPPAAREPAGPCAAPQAPELVGEVPRLEMLRRGHCRWPIGDPRSESFTFCGRCAAAPPYCADHRVAAYLPKATPGRARAARG